MLKRDKNDMTETGAINALANVEVKHLINEDIMNLDLNKIVYCRESVFSSRCMYFNGILLHLTCDQMF